jgi:hypothetical protein
MFSMTDPATALPFIIISSLSVFSIIVTIIWLCCSGTPRQQALTSIGGIKIPVSGNSGGLDSGGGYILGTPSSGGGGFYVGAVADVGGISCGSSSRHVGCTEGDDGSSGVGDNGSGDVRERTVEQELFGRRRISSYLPLSSMIT